MRVIGVDPSLAGTGLAGIVNGAAWTETIGVGKFRGHDRLAHIVTTVNGFTEHADLVVIEGPAYGSAAGARQSGHHERAGLWWMLTHSLWKRQIPTAVMPPNARAMYGTGKSNAAKDVVLAATIRRFVDVEIMDNNQADSLLLAHAGADYLGAPVVVMPALNRGALAKVQWPELGQVAA